MTTRMQGREPSVNAPAVPLAPEVCDVWELDFYSRPVVGVDGKKLWELIITDADGGFQHVEAIPNAMVNSRELRKRVQSVIDESVAKPRVIRFFRVQMFNMIQIALSEIDVQVSPSRRTYALYQVIKEREESVYRNLPGFQESMSRQAGNFQGIDLVVAQRLPDALRCESFAFGAFPLGQLQEFFESANPKDYFGGPCPVQDEISMDSMVPGLIIFSKRAYPLAAWMDGVEVAFIKALLEKQEVLLECGLNTSYKFVQITNDLKDDARSFETRKADASGLHFLAVQSSADADEVDGMWLLCES